ncbi:hypothetical protein NE237_006645 [Protea cynaroides]|uniref:Kinesin motor domain-containing protein n=1 Tax=Protea cynaroides TaxID=273540 RepID=A0A9Q0KNG6_9MAGN|nr:hypothetical protein NE237_006645 [Protea cynaroides]
MIQMQESFMWEQYQNETPVLQWYRRFALAYRRNSTKRRVQIVKAARFQETFTYESLRKAPMVLMRNAEFLKDSTEGSHYGFPISNKRKLGNYPFNCTRQAKSGFGGVVKCVLDRLKPGSINEWGGSDHSSEACVENVKRFLSAMDQMGLPKFRILDLEQGSMDTVVECLLSLKKHYNSNSGGENVHITSSMAKSGTQPRKRWKLLEVESSEGIDGSCGVSPGAQNTPVTREERRKSWTDSKFQRVLRSPVMSEPSAALIHHVGHKFQEVFQLKQGRYADIPAAKISEIMKSNSLDNAPTQSLLSVVNGILDESVERKNGEIPHRVACLLRKVVQEIERRIATQAEHLRTQNNLYKAREEKYQSRLRVLETLATGTSEETQVATNKFQHIKMEKTKMEEKKKLEEQDMVKLTKEKDHSDLEISTLKQELELAKQKYEQRCLQLETQAKGTTVELEVKLKELENQRCQQLARLTKEKDHSDLEISTLKQELELAKQKYEQRCLQLETQAMGTTVELEVKLKELEDQRCQQLARLTKEKDHSDLEISTLKQELELAKQKYEQHCLQLETQAMGTTVELEVKLKELEGILEDSRKNVQELKSFSESKAQIWNKKEHSYQNFVDLQFKSLQELRFTSQSIKQVVLHTQRLYSEEFSRLGVKLKGLADVAENYHMVLAENRKLYNEVQDLKGNIRVYCRIRPFLPGQNGKQTTIDFIGENGEMIIVNPLKQGKDSRRPFKFNKVYGPTATQEQVFLDTQPLVRSILDGYNVCIFAYGQTGSGKTYTMNGPDGASKEEWGVNFRALNDLFNISESRRNSFVYEIGVQIVEIYNEQVRDLLASDSSQKKYPFLFI